MDVEIRNKKDRSNVRIVSRTAANVLIASGNWEETNAPAQEAPKKKSHAVNAADKTLKVAKEETDLVVPETLKGLREQYKELTGKDADPLQSEAKLMEEISLFLEGGQNG